MRRHLKRIALFLLAVVFLVEAWLWDVTGAVIKRALGWLPYAQLKIWVAARVEHLSPWLTLCVFIIPALVLLPLKFLTVFLLAKGLVLPGLAMMLLAKLAGLGISSFLFALCKPKLMELRGVRWLYDHLIYWRERARVMVSPYTNKARALAAQVRALLPQSNFLSSLRSRVHKWRKEQQNP